LEIYHLKYQQKEIKLDNPLSFWKHFDKEERILFYNPLKKELIIGAGRLKTFAQGESFKGYLYVFSSRTFFHSIKNYKWADFGNETIAFANYLIVKNGKQVFYSLEGSSDTENIENPEITTLKHSYTVESNDYAEWEELFNNVLKEISLGNVNKVVISREVRINCDTQVNTESILKNLLEKNQNCFVFAYSKNGKTFLGASPEIIVEKEKDRITSYALAGTILRNDKNDEEQKKKLLNDGKNLFERQIVQDAINEVMKKHGSEVIVDKTEILTLKNLHHLKTRITCRDNASLSEWVTRLHPTPALGGNPVRKSLELSPDTKNMREDCMLRP
jgi:menaquinone-specific isochorismate synthase